MIRAFSSIMILATALNIPFGIPNKVTQLPLVQKQEIEQVENAQINKKVQPVKNINNEQLIKTNWKKSYNRGIEKQNKFNKDIIRALKKWDRLDPLILKSIMAQESGFRTHKRNRYGYTGIAQLGALEAREMGLVVKKGCDQRKTPYYAIPAAAKLMRRKAMHLHQKGFSKYGTPQGDEYWKFVAAAYNAGEGTIVKALKYAYGNTKPKQVKFEDLLKTSTGSIWDTPLFKAMPRRWKRVAKYKEIKTYAVDVIRRARQV